MASNYRVFILKYPFFIAVMIRKKILVATLLRFYSCSWSRVSGPFKLKHVREKWLKYCHVLVRWSKTMLMLKNNLHFVIEPNSIWLIFLVVWDVADWLRRLAAYANSPGQGSVLSHRQSRFWEAAGEWLNKKHVKKPWGQSGPTIRNHTGSTVEKANA